MASVETALKEGPTFEHEERIFRPDGSMRHLQSVGEAIRDQSGQPIRLLGVCLDVTERKQAERALSNSEQTYRMLLRGVRGYAIYMLDAEGRVRTWNEGARRLKGYAPEEIVGRHLRVFLPPEQRETDMADQVIAAAARQGQFEAQTFVVRKDGSSFYADVVVDALRDDSGELIGFAKLVRDISVPARGADCARRHPRAARAGAEDGGARPAHRRHRARFQQSADDRVRLCPDPAAAV